RFPRLPRSINKNPVAAILLLRQPRDPEVSASIFWFPFSRLESRLLLRFTEAIFQRPHGKVRLFPIDQERWRQANGVLSCAEHQQAFMKSQIDDRVTQIRGLFLRPLIPYDLNADHQAASSYIAHDLEILRPIGHSPEEVVAHAAGVFHVLAFDQVHSGQRCRNAHWLPTERRAMRARLPSHHAFFRDHRAERHAAGDALGGTKNVRFDPGVFTGPPLPRASYSRLHFVHDKHDSVLPADPLQFLQEKLRRGHISAFSLNRLDDDTRDILGIEQALENLRFELFENFRAAGLL